MFPYRAFLPWNKGYPWSRNDSTAILTGGGTATSVGGGLLLLGVASAGDAGADAFTGDFAIGASDPLAFLFISIALPDLSLFFNSFMAFSTGDPPTGSATITLDVETWAAVGTTGNVTGVSGGSQGTWEMVSAVPVPEPGTLALFGLGLAGLGFARRRKGA